MRRTSAGGRDGDRRSPIARVRARALTRAHPRLRSTGHSARSQRADAHSELETFVRERGFASKWALPSPQEGTPKCRTAPANELQKHQRSRASSPPPHAAKGFCSYRMQVSKRASQMVIGIKERGPSLATHRRRVTAKSVDACCTAIKVLRRPLGCQALIQLLPSFQFILWDTGYPPLPLCALTLARTPRLRVSAGRRGIRKTV